MATKRQRSVLIVAGPGALRSGLEALVTTIPQIEIAGETEDISLVRRMIIEHHPDLVLLDTNLPDGEAWVVLRQIKSEWPETQCVALAEDVEKQQQAADVGADATLIKGFPATKLIATLENLLSHGGT